MSAAFRYDPLQKAVQEIRLVRLLDSNDEAIRCQMSHFPSHQPPKYTALSYGWGASARTVRILVNGKQLCITTSLKSFFQELTSRRRTSREPIDVISSWLWIDAICINQEDRIERSSQVAKMKEIYENAHSMIIWLGKATTDNTSAVELLKQIVALDEEPELSNGDVPGVTCRFGNADRAIETSYKALKAASKLFKQTYWDRTWILQEASTPKLRVPGTESDCITWVFCGDATITWDIYSEANERLTEAAWQNPVRPAFRPPGCCEWVDSQGKASRKAANWKKCERSAVCFIGSIQGIICN